MYTIAEVTRLHREELLGLAQQQRLVNIAQPAMQTVEKAPTTDAVLSGMGRGLKALLPGDERRPRRV